MEKMFKEQASQSDYQATKAARPTSCRMLLQWRWHNSHKNSTNPWLPSKVGPHHITFMHLVLVSQYYTGRSLQGETSVRQEATTFHWPRTGNDVYTLVHKCPSCPQSGSQVPHYRKTQHFLPAGPLEFVVTGILGSLQRNTKGNQHFFIITDRLSKQTRAIPTAKITRQNYQKYPWAIRLGHIEYLHMYWTIKAPNL